MTTQTKLVTLDEVNELLTDIVSQVPEDYVYINPNGKSPQPGRSVDCEYANMDGTPSCLVGHVLHRVGMKLPLCGSLAPIFNHEYPFARERFDSDAINRLQMVQTLQDAGTPWHEAIK